MKIIVGLGNPTAEYANTFHNMGFMAIDALAEKMNKKVKKGECQALTSTFSYKGDTVVLAKPQTYMNLSGQSVKSLSKKYNCSAQDIIVLFDDFDINRFTLRARESGSGGSHNGMKNIIAELNSQEIKRIRIGIGQEDKEKKDYVLSEIKKDDKKNFADTINKLADALIAYLDNNDFEALMRAIN